MILSWDSLSSTSWHVTLGDSRLSRANNFRIRLLVGCDSLEKDAARFRMRNTTHSPHDPSCKLCLGSTEDAHHFVAVCPSLKDKRQRLLANVPSAVRTFIPDHSMRPLKFTNVILGTEWIDELEVQTFIIDFLQQLRTYCLSKLSGL